MTRQRNIVDRMIGLEEKREFREFEERAKNLGPDYYKDYCELKNMFGFLEQANGAILNLFLINFWICLKRRRDKKES